MEFEERKKKFSVFYTLILFIIIISLVGLYINNIVVYHSLSKQNKQLREKIGQINLDNYKKRVEIESLTSFVRINNLASEKLNLTYNESAIDKREIIINIKGSLKK